MSLKHVVKDISIPIKKYLQTRAITSPWKIEGCTETGFKGAVVIPALAESAHLLSTLRSLAANSPDLLVRFLVLVVINHREDSATADKADNHATLAMLKDEGRQLKPLRLAWVDAASPG